MDVVALRAPMFSSDFTAVNIPRAVVVLLKFVLMGAIAAASCHYLERPGNALLQRLIGPAPHAKGR
jgi:peptidoglycan/LPS O-acetylase OafA/YrhL